MRQADCQSTEAGKDARHKGSEDAGAWLCISFPASGPQHSGADWGKLPKAGKEHEEMLSLLVTCTVDLETLTK